MPSKGLGLIAAIAAAVFMLGADAFANSDRQDDDRDRDRREDRDAEWLSAGADLSNSRYQENERRITARTVGSLQLKWTVATDGDVVAHPAVDGDYLYFPDSAGFLYKVNRRTGALVWKKPVSGYTGVAGDFSRGTPAVADNLLILGNQSGKFIPLFGQPAPQPAKVFAVDKRNGNLVWVRQVDDTQMSVVTNSAIIHDDTAYMGIASNEEFMASMVPKANWVWQFRGSVIALDVRTGRIKWKTYTVPPGYFGAGVWSSTGAVDKKNDLLFMTTGNNYAAPQSVLNCLANGTPARRCMSPDNHFDSIIALDLDNGRIKWSARGLPSDVWNVACGLNVPPFIVVVPGPPWFGTYDNCPNGNPATAGPDHDFAQGPMLFGDDLVGAGQKSGRFWAFDRKTGELAWSKQVVPGGVTGGMQWGSATDGRRIFVAASNSGTTTVPASMGGAGPWKQKDGTTTTSGGWAAIDAKDGDILWTTKDPVGSRSEAPVSATNDVVFGCNLAFGIGTMVAMDARTGAIKWSYNSLAPCNSGATIADGMVYWGSGTGNSTGNKKLHAFGL